MVFNATFNNISVISWWSALLVDETGVPGENHRSVASHWQTLSGNIVHLALIEIRTHNISVQIRLIIYSETCLKRTLSKPKACLNQTDFTVPSTKCLYNLNLCKPNTCLNWTNSSIPKGFGLDRFYCIYKCILQGTS